MNPLWQDHLMQRGARVVGDRVIDFGHAEAETRACKDTTILCDLSHFELIAFSGSDSETFLQGQLSNDVRKLAADTSQYSCYCTPKGRMLASLLVWRSADGYVSLLPGELKAGIQKRLAMYVMRSKVSIQALDQLIVIGIAGIAAVAILEKVFGTVPATLGVVAKDDCNLIRVSETRFIITAPFQAIKDLWDSLGQDAMPVGAPCWDWLTIKDGIPVITSATQEEFVPQMTNFELIGGVSFKKGCYPGQEIVARMQYLGKLKRRMYLANVVCDAAPLPGDELFSVEMEGQSSGMIVNVAPSPDGGFDLLAVIQISSVETADIHWKRPDGPILKMLPLPYPIQT